MAMRYWSHSTWALVLPLIVWGAHVEAHPWQVSARTTTNSSAPQLQTSYAQLPLYFEANQGQADATVKFLARGSGYTLALTAQEAVLALAQPGRNGEMAKRGNGKEPHPLAPNVQSSMVRMQLVGANASPIITGLAELSGKTNYFVGKDAAQWRTNIPTYAKVKYEQIYPGIDLVYYGNQQQLEYDFIVQPGADPKAIRLAFAGVSGQAPLRIEDAGDLALSTAAGDVRLHRPHIYQEIDGIKTEIEGRYVRVDSEGEAGTSLQSLVPSPQIGFAVAAYDTTEPLIIDPVLRYSVFVAQNNGSTGPKVAVDTSGNVYVSGSTVSAGLPPKTSLRPFSGETDAFIVKLDPTGTMLLYTTYLGGSNADEGRGIAVDSEGNVYVTGSTFSRDFPTTTGALMPNCPDSGPQSCNANVFATKLNAAGSALVYSTYLGGSGEDRGADIAVDASGNAFVTGHTWSPDFPTQHPFQTWHGDPSCGVTRSVCVDAFVTKLNVTGTALGYSSYLGGNGRDEGNSIAVDAAGSVYITGFTESIDFPTVNPAQPTFGGPFDTASGNDAFVVKVNVAGSGLVYATYLGGKRWDEGRGIAVDSLGNAYVTGWTESTNFPTVNPLLSAGQESTDAFISKVSPAGSTFAYSFRLGGSSPDEGTDIAVDGNGNVYVTGISYSDDFPTVHPLQANRGGGICPTTGGGYPCPDAFVTKIRSAGDLVSYSSYLGGGGFTAYTDEGSGIAVDVNGNAYVTGSTSSSDFPADNPFHILRSDPSSSGDVFITKIVDSQTGSIIAYLETPEEGPVSGIAVVRGWAFSTQPGVSITEIELLINGQPVSEIPGIQLGKIPCCSERPDVRDVFPQFPHENTLQSGWGATVNWNWLKFGGHQARVRIRDSAGNLFFTDSRSVNVAKPGGFEFLDQFNLSRATVQIVQDPFTTPKDALTVAIARVRVRDKATQQQKTVNTRFRWFTSTQSLGLVQAETVGISSAQWVAPPFSTWFASLASRIPGWSLLASAQAAPALVPYFEDPAPQQIVSGIRIIRGWAFSEEATARISAIRLTTDMDSQGTIPCCSGRGDVAVAFSGQPNALNSGWGATFNYGNLSAGPHTIGVQIEDSTGAAVSLAHNVTVVRLGGYAFVDQFDLSDATARIEGEEIILSGVVVRDKASQQTKTIEVRLRWSQSSQGLEIIGVSA